MLAQIISDTGSMIKQVVESHAPKHIGTFTCTAYAYTGNRCAGGNYPEAGRTIACNSLPFDTVVWIEGVGVRVVEDRGARWHSDNWLDVYMGDTETCYQWGRQEREVFIIE